MIAPDPEQPICDRQGDVGMVNDLADLPSTSAKLFDASRHEAFKSAGHKTLEQRDVDASWSVGDRAAYLFENAVAADPGVRMYTLIFFSVVSLVICSALWLLVAESPHFSGGTYSDALFFTLEVLATGGFTTSIGETSEKVVFSVIILTGLLVFAVLVGFISDSVHTFMESLANGRTKVVENGHTLILGWNASTVRVVCQIAFLRRQWKRQNETCLRRWFPWLRVAPSTPVAKYAVVVLANTKSKAEMDDEIAHALAERGITPARTKVGWDIICRVGDPRNVHDLIRVGAQCATSICLMLTDMDSEEQELSHNKITNGASVRSLLALRHVLYTSQEFATTFHSRRVVVQLQTECEYLDSMSLLGPGARPIVTSLNMSVFVNTLMFMCASSPGLSRILLSLLDFDGPALRCRSAHELRAGKQNALGGLIGLTMQDAMVRNRWDGAVLIGVSSDDGTFGEIMPGNPLRVIKHDDIVIFICESSMPKVTDETVGLAVTAADQIMAQLPENTANADQGIHKKVQCWFQKKPRVLVCGWRPLWSTDHERLRQRIKDVGIGLQDSEMCFMNMISPEDFCEHMKLVRAKSEADNLELGCKQWSLKSSHRGKTWSVKITHCCGDSASLPDLRKLLQSQSFGIAIVLGTQFGVDLPPHAQDSRVLTVCLLLRHLSDHQIHIVSENQEDQTALLAVTPQAGKDAKGYDHPDFINTQAINARALVMALAYPEIQAAVSELFDDNGSLDNGTPVIDTISPASIGIVNKSVAFGAVQIVVGRIYTNGLIAAIGYFDAAQGNELFLAPNRGSLRLWGPDDQIAVLRRDFKRKKPGQEANAGETSQLWENALVSAIGRE